MTKQLESQHFFRAGDTVRDNVGRLGTVVEAMTLYAIVEWSGPNREEVDQFDPGVVVVARKKEA